MGFISKLKEILSRKKILRLQEAQNQQRTLLQNQIT